MTNLTTLHDFVQTHHKTQLVFDFDETISKLLIDWTGYYLNIETIIQTFDPTFKYSEEPWNVSINRAVRQHGNQLHQALLDFSAKYEQTHYTGHTPNPILVQFLQNLPSDVQVHLYTSNMAATVAPALAELHLATTFEQQITRERVHYVKPDPEGFTLLYDQQVPKEAYVMIGDSHNDSGAAKAFGIDFLSVHHLIAQDSPLSSTL
jgi:HAD superfamily hydrolase (TIGR01509 family)